MTKCKREDCWQAAGSGHSIGHTHLEEMIDSILDSEALALAGKTQKAIAKAHKAYLRDISARVHSLPAHRSMASLSQWNWDEEAAAGPSAGLDPSQSIKTDSDTSGELLFRVRPRKQSRNTANEALLLMVQNNEHHQQVEDAFHREMIQVQCEQLGLQCKFINLGINVLNTMQSDIQSLRNSMLQPQGLSTLTGELG